MGRVLLLIKGTSHRLATNVIKLRGQEVLAFARMTMHFLNNGGDPDFRQDRNP